MHVRKGNVYLLLCVNMEEIRHASVLTNTRTTQPCDHDENSETLAHAEVLLSHYWGPVTKKRVASQDKGGLHSQVMSRPLLTGHFDKRSILGVAI